MIMLTTRIALATFLSLWSAAQLYAQETLDSARELYASAQYDEALRVLDRLSDAVASEDDRQSVDLYRSLCLLAVGRRDDADRAIEAIISRDPLYRLADDLSPRTRTAFSEAKRRVLPVIVQQQYAEAKSAFDRKEFESAAAAFERVIAALQDPDILAAAKQPPLADLRTLAAGFHDLSVKAIPPPPPPPAPEVVEPPAPVAPKIYSAEEPGLRVPVTLSQEMPRYPGVVPLTGIRGIVEVVIDEKGSVESCAMVVPVTSSYDKAVLNAASRWQFQPATMNGTPVKFRKRIQIFIAPPTR